ncbi:putative pyridoxine protein [Phaeoacremonium minimum UCRPA7]|uniref:glutaminase n=1 Tax=Phaeoacremonium minimum (strain UCR-PA7) TaxID=1286976 RepID=R8BP65_PHAM7|nr:putative pyridoxine protein [Phaeoacremonium minimum UCRPA7]EOO01124.1 putative pyridoxine protein [Phaeoacremonium minimum UCRPA7]
MTVTVGVLALQGGFWEHMSLLHKASAQLTDSGRWNEEFSFIEVRTPEDLARCEALIIPGGESTTIALIAAQSGLLEPLRDFVKVSRKPTWGTCAGLILLSEQANATKKGGQELIGGIDVRVHRNHFGRQIESFVADVDLPFLAETGAAASFPGVFIRAPIVEKLLPHNAEQRRGDDSSGDGQDAAAQTDKTDVEVLAVLPGRTKRVKGGGVDGLEEDSGEVNDIVAVRQGNIIGTSFHPELTDDSRIHVWWLEQVLKTLGKTPLT